ncbi:MAG: response regulator [Thermodesulfobacteriota bacterium]
MKEQETILLVDDDRIDRMAFERYASQHDFPYGYRMAGSVQEASRLLEKKRFDAVVLDYILGDGTAFDLLDLLRDTPFVLITGLGDADTAVTAMKAGAADYLTKDPEGIYLQTLSPTIEKAIRNKHNELELANHRQHLEELVAERTADLSKEIAERKRTEADLRQSEKEWHLTFDAVGEMVTIHDKDFRVVRANQAASELLPNGDTDIIGQKCYSLFCSLDNNCQGCPSLLLKKDLRPRTAEITCSKTQKTFFVSTSPLFDENQEFNGVLHIARDISEWKRMESQLQQSQKMQAIGTLAGGIAHDFNNILTPIIGHAELLYPKVEPDGMVQNGLDIILQSAKRATELVNQILSFSRGQQEKVVLGHLQPVIRETLKLLRSSFPSTIKIEKDLDMQCGPVEADLTQMHQLIMNLCTNSGHAMEQYGGILKVSLSCREILVEDCLQQPSLSPGPHLCIEVSDTGCGMTQDLQDRIFEPYFTTKGKGKGTGLGLAVAHGIVASCKGNISVSSEPGRGSTFRILLPVAREDQARKELALDALSLPRGEEHILLVDDEPEVLDVAEEILTSLGYRVTPENSSKKALELFQSRKNDFDLILTDLTMPEMTGIKLSTEILTIRPEVPVILCTGFSDLISTEQVLDLGIREYLYKPISLHDMATHVRRILDDCKVELSA